MYRNGFGRSGDQRKPTTALFDEYWLEVRVCARYQAQFVCFV
jgi:hypothetical protein